MGFLAIENIVSLQNLSNYRNVFVDSTHVMNWDFLYANFVSG